MEIKTTMLTKKIRAVSSQELHDVDLSKNCHCCRADEAADALGVCRLTSPHVHALPVVTKRKTTKRQKQE